jgi:O-antigen/teichoic acid export membrane protein
VIDARHELKRGLMWFGSATLLMRGLDLVANLVVLHVLTERQMGVAALSWSAAVICESLNGLGVGSALVQAKDVSREQLDGLFWFALAADTAVGTAMAAAAPLIAGFYAEPELTPMVVVSALKLVFVGAALVPLQLLARDLKFRGASVVQTSATALEAATKVVLVLCGAGAWALVIANTARGLYVLAVVYALAPYWPRTRFRLSEIRPFVGFGLRTISSTVIYQTYRNTDFFLIGSYLGMDALGVYRVAFGVAMTPLEVVVQVANRVAFPIYARVASDPLARGDAFARSVRYLLLLSVPIAVILFFGAQDAIALIAHGRWVSAVPLVQLLVWGAVLRALAQLFPTFFQAIGRPEYGVYDALLSALLLVGGFWTALALGGQRSGALAVCAAWLAAYPVVLAVEAFWSRRAAQIQTRTLLRAAWPAIGAGLAMAPVLMWIPVEILRGGLGSLGALCVVIASGIAVYALYLHLALGLRLRDLGARTMQPQIAASAPPMVPIPISPKQS